MDEQPQVNAPHKLVWRWLTNSEAFLAVRRSAVEMEALRVGHGILSYEQFAQGLINGDFEVLLLPNGCVALVTWGVCEDGKVLNILTTVGQDRYADMALECIEAAALERGAKVVMSVGRPGWSALAMRSGYRVTKCILMRKKLDEHSVPENTHSH